MNLLVGASLRRVIPVGAVATVLALSYIAQAPSLASGNDVGYGYANNCGVKGDGTHDHGKACPNRPFPGHGKGVLDILAGIAPSSEGSTTAATGRTGLSSTRHANGVTDTDDATTSTGTGRAHAAGHAHGHGHGRGLGA